jgi:hypothetical protein
MSLRQSTLEFVELVKIDRAGREYRESMPRWLAEITLECIPTEQPEVAYAWITPIEVDPRAPYPAKPVTPQRIWRSASLLALFLPIRTAD